MHIQRIVTVSCGVLLLVSGARSDGPAPQPGPGTALSDCSWVSSGINMRGCYMPPQICPNGPFTTVESCAGAMATRGCPGTPSMRGYWSDEWTGRTLERVPCAEVGQTYSAMACQCFGNIFGWCSGPCEPTGGVVIAQAPCFGHVNRVLACEDEG